MGSLNSGGDNIPFPCFTAVIQYEEYNVFTSGLEEVQSADVSAKAVLRTRPKLGATGQAYGWCLQ
jgi:hypothetical protein